MAPRRSNNAHEKLLSSSSAEDISPNDNQAPSSSPRLRARYLEKVGVDSDLNDDYPLLDGDN